MVLTVILGCFFKIIITNHRIITIFVIPFFKKHTKSIEISNIEKLKVVKLGLFSKGIRILQKDGAYTGVLDGFENLENI